MPKSVSAKKRARQAVKARRKNMSVKSKIGTVRRKALETLSATDLEAARKVYREYCSTLDKAAKQGVIPKNTAIRRKRRAAAKLAKLQAAPAAQPAGT
jgi:small subunit ribosomal protein S20